MDSSPEMRIHAIFQHSKAPALGLDIPTLTDSATRGKKSASRSERTPVSTQKMSRRTFTTATVLGALEIASGRLSQSAACGTEATSEPGVPRRVGAVAYAFQYSIGLFSYKDRPGERMDAVGFVEATREAGGDVAQIYHSMIDGLDEVGLRRLRDRADELDVLLEVHGGYAGRKDFENTIHRAAALGARVVGCSFGMMLRPDKIATLAAWDEHVAKCRARLEELGAIAGSHGVKIAVENHLDFTVEELHDLIKSLNTPNVGVLFDVGNTLGTLDDPLEAAEVLGPLTLATHYKDFAVVENATGFQLTMVPLGSGSLQLRAITQRLLRHVSPDVAFSIEMMNGQQLQIDWLEDRFWVPFRNKTARQVAATLRHIRSKPIVQADFISQSEVDKLPHDAHVKFEAERIARCISYLKELVSATG